MGIIGNLLYFTQVRRLLAQKLHIVAADSTREQKVTNKKK